MLQGSGDHGLGEQGVDDAESRGLGLEDLHGDVATQGALVGEEHAPHAALAEDAVHDEIGVARGVGLGDGEVGQGGEGPRWPPESYLKSGMDVDNVIG